MGCHALLQGTFPETEPASPALAGGFFPAEPPGKPPALKESLPNLNSSPHHSLNSTQIAGFLTLLL